MWLFVPLLLQAIVIFKKLTLTLLVDPGSLIPVTLSDATPEWSDLQFRNSFSNTLHSESVNGTNLLSSDSQNHVTLGNGTFLFNCCACASGLFPSSLPTIATLLGSLAYFSNSKVIWVGSASGNTFFKISKSLKEAETDSPSLLLLISSTVCTSLLESEGSTHWTTVEVFVQEGFTILCLFLPGDWLVLDWSLFDRDWVLLLPAQFFSSASISTICSFLGLFIDGWRTPPL